MVALGTVRTCTRCRASPTIPIRRCRGRTGTPSTSRFAPVVGPLQRAYGVAIQARALARQGFEPDLVVVNTGWGENLFLKDIWPKARHVAYFEYYYVAKGQDVEFDPEFPVRNEEVIWRLTRSRTRCSSAPSTSPTPRSRRPATSATCSRLCQGQDRGHPRRHRGAGPAAGSGSRRSRSARRPAVSIGATPVVTYVTRNIEPMRGSHIVHPQPARSPRARSAPACRRHRRDRIPAIRPARRTGKDVARTLPRQRQDGRRLVARPFRRSRALRAFRAGAAGLLRPPLPDLSIRPVLVADRVDGARVPDRRLGHAARCARSSRTARMAACFPFFDQAALVEPVRGDA